MRIQKISLISAFIIIFLLFLNCYLLPNENLFSNSHRAIVDYIGASPTIFIFSSYIISNNRIRIIALMHCGNRLNYISRINNNNATFIDIKLTKTPIDRCDVRYNPPCTWHGFLLESQLPQNTASIVDEPILIGKIGDSNKRMINIGTALDVRINLMKYTLSACAKPIFVYNDWQMLIQYFETWRTLQVSHFFIYLQLYPPDIDNIILNYEQLQLVERIEWSTLPYLIDEGVDPNQYIHIFEQATANTDCLLRSRQNSKFVILTDFDEIILNIQNPTNLIGHLNEFSANYPTVGAFKYYANDVQMEYSKRAATIYSKRKWMKFKEFQFDYLKDVRIGHTNTHVKLIVRPEKIRRMVIHHVAEFEPFSTTDKNDKTIQKWTELPISANIAALLHLRRLKKTEPENYNDSNLTNSFAKLVANVEQNWNQLLIKQSIFVRNTRYQNGIHLLKNFEKCLRMMLTKRFEICAGLVTCFYALNQIDTQQWHTVGNSWIIV